MKIIDVYQQYHIPHNLAEHMLLTAALGEIICQNWRELNKPDQDFTVTTLITHDVGNLVKFDLSSNQDSLKINYGITLQAQYLTLPYPPLQHVELRTKQQEMRAKYGRSSNQANLKILQELGLHSSAELLQNHSFERLRELIKLPNNWSEKIINYGDLRVIPSGLSSVEDRILDLQTRYRQRDELWADENLVEQRLADSLQLEAQLNNQTRIELTAITLPQVVEVAQQLADYKIEV